MDGLLYANVPLTSSTNIRILSLQPGRWDDPLKYSLEVVSLGAHPSYDALSYVWGTDKENWEISILDNVVKIKYNLYRALRRLRCASKVRILWVDALCINQTSNAEKAAQCARMDEIYQNCTQTWIFLNDYGSEPPSTDGLFWYGEKITAPVDGGYGAFATVMDIAKSSKKHLDEIPIFTIIDGPSGPQLRVASESVSQGLSVLVEVMTLDWWRRIWVLQEAILAPHATVVLGSIRMPFEVFAIAATCLEIHSKCCEKLILSLPGFQQLTENFILNMMQIGWTRSQHRRKEGWNPKLHDLLWQYRCHRSIDPRDMIFVLLSFMKNKETPIDLVPDYDVSKKEVYRRAIEFSVKQTKKLSILQGQRTPQTDMPSWIYDWSLPMETREWHGERQRLRNSHYSTSGEEPASISCDINYNLKIKGIFVDVIQHVGERLGNSRFEVVSAWKSMSGNLGPTYRNSIELFETAFWRTSTRDYMLSPGKDFQRIENAVSHAQAAAAWLEASSQGRSLMDSARNFELLLGNLSVGMQFFVTKNGYIGLGTPEPGDQLFRFERE